MWMTQSKWITQVRKELFNRKIPEFMGIIPDLTPCLSITSFRYFFLENAYLPHELYNRGTGL